MERKGEKHITHILLCDDKREELATAETLLRACYPKGETTIHTFTDPAAALNFYENGHRVDLAVLDILMPGIKGTQLAEDLRRMGFTGPLVFLTSSNSFAAESYDVEAVAYLLKPLTREKLLEVVEKIEKQRAEADTAGCLLNWRGGSRFVRFAELEYVEVKGHNLFFHLRDGAVLSVYAPLREYSPPLLKDGRMTQCHKSYIVNLDFVKAFEGRDIVMQGGGRLPLSRSFSDVQAQFLHRMFGR